jgi:hypothetical protein
MIIISDAQTLFRNTQVTYVFGFSNERYDRFPRLHDIQIILIISFEILLFFLFKNPSSPTAFPLIILHLLAFSGILFLLSPLILRYENKIIRRTKLDSYYMKLYKEGIQLKQHYFPWNEIKKIYGRTASVKNQVNSLI